MPQIDLVPNMRKPPGRCGICNTTPNDAEGKPLPAIDCNVDVDWGNNFYICSECVRIIGELMGWVSPETHQKLIQNYEDLESRHETLRERYKELEEKARKVVEGKRAAKSIGKRKKKRRAA